MVYQDNILQLVRLITLAGFMYISSDTVSGVSKRFEEDATNWKSS